MDLLSTKYQSLYHNVIYMEKDPIDQNNFLFLLFCISAFISIKVDYEKQKENSKGLSVQPEMFREKETNIS